jgi:hypothetical protein
MAVRVIVAAIVVTTDVIVARVATVNLANVDRAATESDRLVPPMANVASVAPTVRAVRVSRPRPNFRSVRAPSV